MILNEGYDKTGRVDSAGGKYIRIDGQALLDTSMGVGTHIFGHGALIPQVKKALDQGTLFTAPNKIADECAELLTVTTGFRNFVFCNTGSEATMRCIRIARAYTGRDKIALFEGCWHGTHDWNLALYSEGIPQAVKDLVITLPFTKKSFDRIGQGDIALAMIEPVQASLPLDRREFLNSLKAVCNKTGTALCFDEVISGFRMALGGAAQYFGIKPDLVSYGKIAGGGFPIGIVAGDEVMEIIKKGRGVRMGGTFSANPLTMSACREMLTRLIFSNPYESLHKTIGKLFIKCTNGLENFQIMTLGGMARIIYTDRPIKTLAERDKSELPQEKQVRIRSLALKKGIYLNPNNTIMLSTLHTEEDVFTIKEILRESFQ